VAILKQLEEEGILTLNKELELTALPHRIAVISSPTAAGYEDFCNQLENNPKGFKFYTKLFPAIMQGDRVESSVIDALEKVYEYIDSFDAVAILRGGGATSDLSCFDSYLLAANCAQFPLPIITGIGHERDETVLDFVAHTRAKTPTAVAEFFINQSKNMSGLLDTLQNGIMVLLNQRIQNETAKISSLEASARYAMRDWDKNQMSRLHQIGINIKKKAGQTMKESASRLDVHAKYLELLSPENVLKKGYSLTLHNGKIIKSAKKIHRGTEIKTILHDGEIDSIIK